MKGERKKKRAYPISLTKLTIITFLFLFPTPVESRGGSDGIVGCIELIFGVVVLMISLTDKPQEGESRRRVVFKDNISGEIKPGGITFFDMKTYHGYDDMRELKIYKYDDDKFGSSGQFFDLVLNFSKFHELKDVDEEEVYGKFADFEYVGWMKGKTEGMRMKLIWNATSENKQNEEFVKGLRIQSTDNKYFDISITEVKSKPLSWLLRLFFYLANFFYLMLVFGTILESHKNNFKSRYSPCYSLMEMMLLIPMIKMVVLFSFIPVFWFMLMIQAATALLTFVNINIEIKGTYTWIYFTIGAVLCLLQLFVTIDILPFLVMYCGAGLALDGVYKENGDFFREKISFFGYIFYMVFSYYNLANPQYFSVSLFHFMIFLGLGIAVIGTVSCLEPKYRPRENLPNGKYSELEEERKRIEEAIALN